MNNDLILGIIQFCGAALTTGLFAIILERMKKSDSDRTRRLVKQDEVLAEIQENTDKLATHEDTINILSEMAAELKEATDVNSEGVKVLMRYMLQRYHASYMIRGYITSHEKTEFLEAYHVYHSKGGNGTGEGWMKEVCSLPVRDDLPTINPYLEMLKETQKHDESN